MEDFAHRGRITLSADLVHNPVFSLTNKGIRIKTRLIPYEGQFKSPWRTLDSQLWAKDLNCVEDMEYGRLRPLSLPVDRAGPAVFAMADPEQLIPTKQ